MTNNKIKMAEKNGVPDPKQDLLKALNDGDLGGIVSAIIALDDNEFEDLSSGLYGSMDKVFNSTAYHNTVSQHLASYSDIDYEREKKGYDGMIEIINSFEISNQKKEFLLKLMQLSYKGILDYQEDPSKRINITYKKLSEDAIVPTYAHAGDAGADIYAVEACTVNPNETVAVGTGIILKIPKGYEAQIRPRSGMSAKTKLRVANAPGTIDSNYRGEIKVLIDNYGDAPYVIAKGDRIAQMVFNEVPIGIFEEGDVSAEADNTRGENGFGSSGTNTTNE